jgi:4-hydroxy-tetrahydrodipicolinate synthase
MVTPYDEKLAVDYDRAAELAAYLVEHGSDGIVVSGTTGESPVLSWAEKKQLARVVLDAVGKKAKVWLGTGTNDTAATIALNREAEKFPSV